MLARIARWEPHLHATYALDAEAAIAAAHVAETRWQKHRDAGEPIGALDGVPATIKENIATRGVPMPLGTRRDAAGAGRRTTRRRRRACARPAP